MATSEISSYFSPRKFNDDKLVERINFIEDCMDRNPLFPDSAPYLQELVAIREAFRKKLMKAHGGTKEEKLEKNNFRPEVIIVLEKLEQHLQQISKDDKELILFSGFYGPQKHLPYRHIENFKVFDV
jgi:hypothetical protein